jgi:hypothetical protein
MATMEEYLREMELRAARGWTPGVPSRFTAPVSGTWNLPTTARTTMRQALPRFNLGDIAAASADPKPAPRRGRPRTTPEKLQSISDRAGTGTLKSIAPMLGAISKVAGPAAIAYDALRSEPAVASELAPGINPTDFRVTQAYPSMAVDDPNTPAVETYPNVSTLPSFDIAPDAGGAMGGYPAVDYGQMAQDWGDPTMMLAPTDPTGGLIDIDALAGMFDVGPMSMAQVVSPVTDQDYIDEGTIPPGDPLDYTRFLDEQYGGPALEPTVVADPLATLAERTAVMSRHPDIGYPSAIGTSFGEAGVDMNTPFGVQFSGFPTAEEQALAEPILSPLDIIGGGTPAAARFIGKQVSKLGPLLERTLSGPLDAAKRATLEKLGAVGVKATGLDFDPLLKGVVTSKADEVIDVMVDIPVGTGGVRFEKYNLASKRFVNDEINDFLSKKAIQWNDQNILPSNPHMQGFPTDKSVMQSYFDRLPVSAAKKATQTTSKPYGDYPPGWVGGPLSVAPMSIYTGGDPTIPGLVTTPTVTAPAPVAAPAQPAGPSAADIQRDKQAAVDARNAEQARQEAINAQMAQEAAARQQQQQAAARQQAIDLERMSNRLSMLQGSDRADPSEIAALEVALGGYRGDPSGRQAGGGRGGFDPQGGTTGSSGMGMWT